MSGHCTDTRTERQQLQIGWVLIDALSGWRTVALTSEALAGPGRTWTIAMPQESLMADALEIYAAIFSVTAGCHRPV